MVIDVFSMAQEIPLNAKVARHSTEKPSPFANTTSHQNFFFGEAAVCS